jgi:OOP family OmpA-OmpF porin
MKEDFVRLKKWDVFETREAYYYIDDISVIKEDSVNSKLPDTIIAHTLPDSLVTGEVIEIKNIRFENGSATLLESSYKVIDELVVLLNKHPATAIQINGHTDNTGDETANMELSNARAKSVYDYLLEKHVSNPMKYQGYGSSRPVSSNDSDENKAKNRRVEILIIKQ